MAAAKKRRPQKPPANEPSGSTQRVLVKIDAEYGGFREDLSKTEERILTDFLRCAEKIAQMTWEQVFATSSKGRNKRGINWEPIGQLTKSGKRVHTIRISRACRARVVRSGAYMIFLSLHEDHDSAYTHQHLDDV